MNESTPGAWMQPYLEWDHDLDAAQVSAVREAFKAWLSDPDRHPLMLGPGVHLLTIPTGSHPGEPCQYRTTCRICGEKRIQPSRDTVGCMVAEPYPDAEPQALDFGSSEHDLVGWAVFLAWVALFVGALILTAIG